MNAPTLASAAVDAEPLTLHDLADRIRARWRLFPPGGAPDAELDALTDADEIDLHKLAAMRPANLAERRAKAAVLLERSLEGREASMSFGERALLWSLVASLNI